MYRVPPATDIPPTQLRDSFTSPSTALSIAPARPRMRPAPPAVDTMPYGVSNSFKRGTTMKTYGGRHARALAPLGDRPRLRIAMDAHGFACEQRLDADSGDSGPRPLHSSSHINSNSNSNSNSNNATARRASGAHASTVPSSPTESVPRLFSDAGDEQLSSESPPSSPPLHRASPPPPTHRPIFRSLKRKRPTTEDADTDADAPLSETRDHANARRLPAASKRTRLTQMQLDLGRSTRRTCRECGMEYVPSSREDERLHKDFHALHEGGVELGAGFAREAHTVERFGFGEVVARLDAHSPVTLRRRVRRVLEVVRADLGAVDIPDETLWGPEGKKARPRPAADASVPPDPEDRFKLFVYLAGDKCVGVCLAERIRHAVQVVDNPAAAAADVDDDNKSTDTATNEHPRPDAARSALQTETSLAPVLLGIARVWVSRSHRRKGIATTLLDAARSNFFYGIEVPRTMVAFSQPTESGRQLAEEWFGQRAGWHVYAE